MKNPKIVILSSLVIILVVLNVVAISSIWMHKIKDRPRSRPPFVILEEELNLTKDQKMVYKELRIEHRKMIEQTRNEASQIRQQLHQFENMPDEETIRMLSDSLGKLHAVMEKNTYLHFSKVRAICTTEQKEKFDSIIHDVLQNFGGPPPHKRSRNRDHKPQDE